MDSSRFTLELALGNEAMQNPTQVADALRLVAKLVESGDQVGNIRDTSGNTVGWFGFRPGAA